MRRIFHPHLGQGGIEGELARDAGGVRVEHVCHDAVVPERIPDEMRFGQVGGGVDLLQNLYETVAPMPSWWTPERDDTFW
jgi:hypothetical protein